MFESYWNSGDFVPYDREIFLAQAQQSNKGGTFILSAIELRPEPFQERLIEEIELSRQRGHHRNLLVSATGTGKTVMAAIDYARLRERLPRARLLFVAHRKEILEQSLGTFRQALRSHSFGELWVDGRRPSTYENVFGVHDGLDLRNVPWKRGHGYDVEGLTNVLTANDAAARLVAKELVQRVEPGRHEQALRRACGRLLHVDDPVRLEAYRRFLALSSPPQTAGLPPDSLPASDLCHPPSAPPRENLVCVEQVGLDRRLSLRERRPRLLPQIRRDSEGVARQLGHRCRNRYRYRDRKRILPPPCRRAMYYCHTLFMLTWLRDSM